MIKGRIMKTTIKKLNKFIALLSLIFFLGYHPQIAGQADVTKSLDENEINSLVSKLAKKLLLDEKQAENISNILREYSEEAKIFSTPNSGAANENLIAKQQLVSDTNSKIEKLFSGKQKMKYEIIRDDWWKEIKIKENN